MRHTARNLTLLGLGLGVSSVIGWLLFRETRRGRLASRDTSQSSLSEGSLEIPQIVLPMQPPASDEVVISSKRRDIAANDDLTRIRDIGPKFAEALKAAGITRFEQLTQETPDTLAGKLAPFVNVRPQRIRDNDWIGQAERLSRNTRS